MLGKQWLNRYNWTDMRGSAVERSHNRQKKLSGIVAWYFNYVMEALPLMLQAALLLLGCALSRYLWDINTTIASVALGVTSCGVLFYLFILIAGTAFESCPYQTPGARILRYTFHNHLPALRSGPSVILAIVSSKRSKFIQTSRFFYAFSVWWSLVKRPWYSASNIAYTLIYSLFIPPFALAVDTYHLGRVALRLLVAFCRAGYHWSNASLLPGPVRGQEQRSIIWDLRCISWAIQTSLDKSVHTSAFKRLVSIPELSHLDPTLVTECFNVFIGCINVSNGKVFITQGLEQLANLSASGFLRTFHHLIVMDPTSSVLLDLHRRYNEVFPTEVDFTGLPFHFTMNVVHTLVNHFGNPRFVWWKNHVLPGREHTPFSCRTLEVARLGYRRTRCRKVPRWVLRSALHFLSLEPLSPASVVADCLGIIAIDINCDVSGTTGLDERCVRI